MALKEILGKITGFFMDTLESIVVALAIFVVCYLFLFQVHEIKGASMEPNFSDTERILTDKISYRFGSPKRGDVIIFRAPKNRELDYVKRIIGLPGEKVKVSMGNVYINSALLEENYLASTGLTASGNFLFENREFFVPEDEYLVLGDNRNHSSDSREWGTVSRDDIIGKVMLRIWPPAKFGFLRS